MDAGLYSQTSRMRAQGHPINAQRAREGKPPANVVLLRGCGSRRAPGSQ
jgi:2,3-bisphosphoglycerate-independent phosphoglycerate mutase